MTKDYGFTSKEMDYIGTPCLERKLNRDSAIHWHIRIWGMTIFLILMTAVFVRWSEWQTKTASAAYSAYEECVQNTYGVSAVKFYQVYGEAAKCK